MNGPSDHDLLVRLAERVDLGFKRVEERFTENERALTLAREVWPTQKDVAVQLEAIKAEAKTAARQEARAVAEKVERDVTFAREIYPTQKDVAILLGTLREESQQVARREAAAVADRTSQTSEETVRRLAALERSFAELGAVGAARQRTQTIVYTAIGSLAALGGLVAFLVH